MRHGGIFGRGYPVVFLKFFAICGLYYETWCLWCVSFGRCCIYSADGDGMGWNGMKL